MYVQSFKNYLFSNTSLNIYVKCHSWWYLWWKAVGDKYENWGKIDGKLTTNLRKIDEKLMENLEKYDFPLTIKLVNF